MLGYDKLSQRRTAEYTFQGQNYSEVYSYSRDGYLQTTTQAIGQNGGVLINARALDAVGRSLVTNDLKNQQVTTSTYDADGRLLVQSLVDGKDNSKSYQLSYYYYGDHTGGVSNPDPIVMSSTVAGRGELAKTVMHMTADGATNTTRDVATSYSYQYWDSAQQLSASKTGAQGTSGLTTFSYNANGHLRSTYDSVPNITQTYVTSANGLILQRTRTQGASSSNYFYYYADGRRVGDVGNTPDPEPRVSYAEQLAIKATPADKENKYLAPKAVSSADFDQNFQPINDSYPSATAGSYTVRSSTETLASIAQSVWGDRAMWYLLADANGLSASSELKAGQVLVIPNKVTNIHNNASTWRPYNAGEAIGNTDPTLSTPPPPPQQGGGCGAIGIVLMVVVAVVATVVTAGAAAAAMGAALPSAGLGGLMSLGASVLTGAGGLTLAGGLAAAAIGGAVGSIASQTFGMAIGQVDSFSWKAVGQAALGSAVTAGVGAGLNQAGLLAQSGGAWSAAGRAALSTGANLALHGDWSWRDVMISAASAGIGAKVGSAASGTAWGDAMGGFGSRMAGGLAGGLTARALSSGRRASYATVFASTLGSAVGRSLTSPAMQGQGPWSDGAYRNGSDIADDITQAGNAAMTNGASLSGAPMSFVSSSELADPSDRYFMNPEEGGWRRGYVAGGSYNGEYMMRNLDNAKPTEMIPIEQLPTVVVEGRSAAASASRMLTLLDGGSSVSFLDAVAMDPLPVPQVDIDSITSIRLTLSPAEIRQAQTDAAVTSGTYNAFTAMGNDVANRDWGGLWFHATYTPQSTSAIAAALAASERVFGPQATPEMQRIDQMAASPWGATASLIGRALGASQQHQDALLQTGAFFENGLGAATGIYKQTLTAKAPLPGTFGSVVRGNRSAGPIVDNTTGTSGTFSAESPYVIRYNPAAPGRPDPQYSLNSLTFENPIGYNSLGYPRDAGKFWKEWAGQNPNSLSPSNKYLIENYDRLKVSPRVDQKWIDTFPEHGNYMGDVLIHHHVNFGQYTIPVPGQTHIGSGGPWHF